jgi:hypothetical protein
MRAATKGDYEVGYGKPPRGTGFKKGQSGNPRGRPPLSKNLTTLLNDTLNEPVTITEDDRRRKITKREAVIKPLVNKSASGDPRSLNKLPRMEFGISSFCAAPLRRFQNRQSLFYRAGHSEHFGQQAEKARFVVAPSGRLRGRQTLPNACHGVSAVSTLGQSPALKAPIL